MPQIKKADMVPGAHLKIRETIKDGCPGFGLNIGGQTLPHLRMTQAAGSIMDGHRAINSGDIVEVVQGPKRRGEGGNTIIVRDATGVEGHVFWCEMRASADLV
jgi:hypothetical protein